MINEYLNTFKGVKRAKIENLLKEKQIRLDGVIYRVHEIIEKFKGDVSSEVQLYSTRKTNLEYKPIKPKTHFFLNVGDGYSIKIDKTAYDYAVYYSKNI